MGPELRVLLAKEWRQLVRNKTALFTALFLPVLMMVVIPASQLFAARAAPTRLPQGMELPPNLVALLNDPHAMLLALLPMMVALGGLLVPAVTAAYTVLAERESRTLELLVALPVRMSQVLGAKLLALVVLTGGLCGLLLAIDATVLLVLGIAGPGYIAALFVLLVAAIAFSTALALLISVLAKDFRSANNISGAFLVPVIMGGMAISLGGSVVLGSSALASLVLAVLFLIGAAVAAWVASRTGTFERLLR